MRGPREHGRSKSALVLALVGACALPGWRAAGAQVVKQTPGNLAALTFTSGRLNAPQPVAPLAEMPGLAPAALEDRWAAFRLAQEVPWEAVLDERTGRVAIAEGGGIAWVPGRGNQLTPADLGLPASEPGAVGLALLERLARRFLPEVADLLGLDPRARLVLDRGRSGQPADHVWFVDFDVEMGGQPIEGARVVFRVNHGNLIQFGAENLPSAGTAVPTARLTRDEALETVASHLGGFTAEDSFADPGSLHLLPVAIEDPRFEAGFEPGRGRGLVKVWELVFHRAGVAGTFRARVDAATGELLELADINVYAQVTGGVYPGSPATGPEAVKAMPYANLSTGGFASSAGVYNFTGTATSSTLSGQFVRISDTCGAISQSSDAAGNIAFGTSAGNNCTTPGTGGAGNTHATRTQFYHVNRGKELGRGWLPANGWLNAQLTVNVNLNQVCNAYWSPAAGTLNFFRSGSLSTSLCGVPVNWTCADTGEVAGVSLHEFGHGLDQNDGTGLENTSEAYADVTSAIALHSSCIGPGFFSNGANCGGYGDACTSCSGIRDIDWGKHASNTPHTVANFTQTRCGACGGGGGPCGLEVHCEAYVPAEAVWDFVNRDLPSPGTAAAWAVLERLWYLSRSSSTSAFSCTPGTTYTSNGCNTGSWWKTMRAIDDDDGNLTNGTPHSCSLFAAFNRHGIACAADPGANVCFAGCAAPAAPAVTLTPGNNQVTVSASGSGVFDVYRNDLGCNAGFIKVANDASGPFTDTGVANGTTYYYQVVAHPAGNEACASAPSACQTAVPALTSYACTVNVSGGTNGCTGGPVTLLSSSGSQRTLKVNMAGFKRLDVIADFCTPTGFAIHFTDSPTGDGGGGDSFNTEHDAEVYLNGGTTLEMVGTFNSSRSALDPIVRRLEAVPAGGCFQTQWSILEDRILFDDDANTSDSPKVSIDSISSFELAPYAEPDAEDSSGADANLWYLGLNRTVGNSARTGTGLTKACLVLSTTTNPSPAAISGACGL